MNNTFWLVAGMAIGVIVAVLFYERDLREVERERDKFEAHVIRLAQEYGEQTIALERLRAKQ